MKSRPITWPEAPCRGNPHWGAPGKGEPGEERVLQKHWGEIVKCLLARAATEQKRVFLHGKIGVTALLHVLMRMRFICDVTGWEAWEHSHCGEWRWQAWSFRCCCGYERIDCHLTAFIQTDLRKTADVTWNCQRQGPGGGWCGNKGPRRPAEKQHKMDSATSPGTGKKNL